MLHHARGTSVHRELRALAEEVARDLGIAGAGVLSPVPEAPRAPIPGRAAIGGIKAALLRGLGRG